MLGFVLSTISFSVMIYALNRRHGTHPDDQSTRTKYRILVLATIVSIAIGWAVDELDGDAAKPHLSITQTMQSGDPVAIAKILIGIN